MPFEIQNSTALVTGASSGLGEEFARQLSGADVSALVLVARRGERLDALKATLEGERPGLRVQVYVCDLADAGQREGLVAFLHAEDLMPDLLINNAGLGDYGEFCTAAADRIGAMLDVNVVAVTHLAHAFAPSMVKRGGGAILNVSSLAGEFPIPDFAVYAATKAYVTSFSEGLRLELREFGVHVSALCPGPISTEFGAVAGRDGSASMPGKEWLRVDSERAVRDALKGLAANRPRVFPGLPVRSIATLAGALPKVLLRALMGTRPKAV